MGPPFGTYRVPGGVSCRSSPDNGVPPAHQVKYLGVVTRTTVDDGEEDGLTPIPFYEFRAAFAIRWDPLGDHEQARLRDTTGRLGMIPIAAEVGVAVIRVAAMPNDGLMAIPEVLESLNGFRIADELASADEPDPLCLVTVRGHAESSINDVISSGDHEDVIHWDGLLRLTDEILHLASNVLGSLAGGHAMGPLAYGDLVGAGVLRLGDPEAEFMDLPLLSRPQLGSWRPSAPSDEVGEPVRMNLLSGRRLLRWSSRFDLRFARGEWAEAVVACEAASEAGMWAILDALLIDHGWSSSDLEGADVPGNAKTLIAALQAHLGGNWTLVRDDLAELWKLRNLALHRSEYIEEADANRARNLAGSITRMVNQRLRDPTVARRHPAATYLYNAESAEVLGISHRGRIAEAVVGVSVHDVRYLNDASGRGPRLTQRANECPAHGTSVWSS